MNVVFRVDASIEIGTGHVMRCLAFAEELRRHGHSCHFVCRDLPGQMGELIDSSGFALVFLPQDEATSPAGMDVNPTACADWLGVSWQVDAQQTLTILDSLAVDWLVVDHYALDERWESLLADVAVKIMVIDDLADRPHKCALLLDQNFGRKVSDYDDLVPADCIRLIGSQYALLRAEFSRLRERSLRRRVRPQLKRILISLGGVDRSNLTGQVLEALSATSLPPETELDVVVGSTSPNLRKIHEQAAKLPFNVTVSVGVGDMAERMCLADLSIGAAGGTSWERCCMGLPALLVVLADNQKSSMSALEESGAAVCLGDGEIVQAVLSDTLTVFMTNPEKLRLMTTSAAKLTAGGGVSEVLGSMMNC